MLSDRAQNVLHESGPRGDGIESEKIPDAKTKVAHVDVEIDDSGIGAVRQEGLSLMRRVEREK